MTEKKAVLVVGAGDATGGEIAKRFAREGYIACVTRRSADKLQPLVDQINADGGQAYGFGSDARKEEEMVSLIAQIEKNIAPIEVAIFNIGANVRFDITETTARVYFKVWEMACFGGFLMGRETAKVMLPRGRGSIFFTGATASLRGRAGYAAFAGAKHGARIGPERHSCCPSDRRWRYRYSIHSRKFPGTLRPQGPRGHRRSQGCRGDLLDVAPAAAHGVDARAGDPALACKLVTAWRMPANAVGV